MLSRILPMAEGIFGSRGWHLPPTHTLTQQTRGMACHQRMWANVIHVYELHVPARRRLSKRCWAWLLSERHSNRRGQVGVHAVFCSVTPLSCPLQAQRTTCKTRA